MTALALLAAAILSATPPAAAEVSLGIAVVPLQAVLEIQTAQGAHRLPLPFQAGEDGRLVARAAAAEWEAEVSLAPPGPGGARPLEASVRWPAGDEGKGLPRIDDLLGGRPDEARAAVAPFPPDGRLWMFRSSMFYARPEVLAAALSDAELAALEEARGLFVAHTYLGASLHTTHTPDHLARLAVRPEAGGGLAIDPALDAAFARLAAQVRAGRLASLTWAEAGDRLRALGDLEVAYRPDGTTELRNHGDALLAGLTVGIPVGPEVELTVDGAPPAGRDDEGGEALVWLDLPPGGWAVLRAFDRLAPLPFLAFP